MTDGNPIKNLEEFIEKVDNMKKQDKMDLSSDQDLTIAIMNLVGIEEHFFFTGAKTGKPEYYDLLNEVREIRKGLLKKIIKEYEGEVWCISKHLLAASYRLMEVGTKQQSMGNKAEAHDLFKKAYELYCLFWGVNMKILKTDDIKKIDEGALNVHDNTPKQEEVKNTTEAPVAATTENKSVLGRLGDIVRKAVDCCIE